jgi:tripartite-type tricarboxylate transporter receptor subunit TctC
METQMTIPVRSSRVAPSARGAARRGFSRTLLLSAALIGLAPAALAAWEPTAPVELVVPAGTGGGADQMARFIQQMVAKHGLMKQPLTVVNKSGNSGAEGLLDMKAAKGNPHKLIITLSNLFTTPLATGTDFSWRDITPVQMLALDQFVLWVHADSPHKSAKDALEALRASAPGSVKLGGTGSKQEDQLISVLLETAASTRLAYLPLKGGGDVAKSLAAREVDLTVNNPIEAAKLWSEGKLRPLCVFDGSKLDYHAKIAGGQSWNDLPTCMSFGIPVQYLMMRGIFTTPGATPDQVAYYGQVLDKVRALPEWKDFMAQGAFKQTVMSGASFLTWLDRAESFHRVLMRESKLMHTAAGAAPTGAPASAPKAGAKVALADKR